MAPETDVEGEARTRFAVLAEHYGRRLDTLPIAREDG